jgi:hypothetical protein
MKKFLQSPDSGHYQIRVRGILDERWVDWFDHFTLTWINQNETLLSGKVKDQAELHGILSRIRDLGLDLLLVKKVDCVCFGKDTKVCSSSQNYTGYKQDKKG